MRARLPDQLRYRFIESNNSEGPVNNCIGNLLYDDMSCINISDMTHHICNENSLFSFL